MGPNMYLYEKAREDHSQDLRREMVERRKLPYLPQHRLSRRVAGKLGVLLLRLGSWLMQFEQSQTALQRVRVSQKL
jgi:hypothetical protein